MFCKNLETVRESVMRANHRTQSFSEFEVVREPSDETIKLIRKLRWIGKEDEARNVERELRQMPPLGQGRVLAEPINTD
jgi:hypothetical protein